MRGNNINVPWVQVCLFRVQVFHQCTLEDLSFHVATKKPSKQYDRINLHNATLGMMADGFGIDKEINFRKILGVITAMT